MRETRTGIYTIHMGDKVDLLKAVNLVKKTAKERELELDVYVENDEKGIPYIAKGLISKPIVFNLPEGHVESERACKVRVLNNAMNAKVKNPEIPAAVRAQIARENARRKAESDAADRCNGSPMMLWR